MAKSRTQYNITPEQTSFYNQNKNDLINNYLQNFPKIVDPNGICDLFGLIMYNRTNVAEFQEICKILTRDIFIDTLRRNRR